MSEWGESLLLAAHTPVLYYDAEDEANDGRGFNVLFADAATVDRFATLDEALVEYRKLLAETSTTR